MDELSQIADSDIMQHRAGMHDGFATVTKRLMFMIGEYIEDDIGQRSADSAYQRGVSFGLRDALEAVRDRWNKRRATPPEHN